MIVGGAALAMLAGALRQRTTQLWAEQSNQARALGLRVTDLGRWVGRRDGVYVVVQVDIEPHDPWSVRAKLPFATPRGFHVGTGRPPRDAALLREAIMPTLERLAARGWRTELGSAVILRRPRQYPPFSSAMRRIELGDGVQTVVSIVRELHHRYRSLIEAGLSRVQGTSSLQLGRPGELRGYVDGIPVTLVGPRLADDHWTLEVRARLTTPLPSGSRVVARRPSNASSSLGDLVLDQALSATSSNLDALARRLARDDVRGPVLDVLAAHPASELRGDEVRHVVNDGALDVSAALDRVIELVHALDGAAPDSPRDHATA